MLYAVLHTNDGILEREGRVRFRHDGEGRWLLFTSKDQASAYILYHEDMCCWACVVKVPPEQVIGTTDYTVSLTDWETLFRKDIGELDEEETDVEQ